MDWFKTGFWLFAICFGVWAWLWIGRAVLGVWEVIQ